MGATEHNTQLSKCSEPFTTPFWKRFYTLRAERRNQGNSVICNDTYSSITVGYTATKTEFPCNTLVRIKAHSNTRTCTWWQIPLLQVQPALLIQDNSGQKLTCWPSVQYKQQPQCSGCVSSLAPACSLPTESICVWSSVLGHKQAAHLHVCTSAQQGCRGSDPAQEYQAY